MDMNKNFKENSAVQLHINILQNIINRMAQNSTNNKSWTITIISAMFVLLVNKGKSDFFWTIYIPLAMFCFLDCFYLGLERYFRDVYKSFVEKLSKNSIDFSDVYKIKGPDGYKKMKMTLYSIKSFSIWPFYLIFALLITLVINLN